MNQFLSKDLVTRELLNERLSQLMETLKGEGLTGGEGGKDKEKDFEEKF